MVLGLTFVVLCSCSFDADKFQRYYFSDQ
jgi:hypothetical protein